MAEFSIRDLWWLQPDQRDVGAEWLKGMQVGAQMKQQSIENTFREEELRTQSIRIRAAAETALAKQVTEAQKAKGMAAISGHLAKVAETNGWGDPKNRSEFWKIGAENSYVFQGDELDKVYNNSFGKYDEYKLKKDEIDQKEKDRTFVPGPSMVTPEGTELVEVSPGHWQQLHGTETIEGYTDEQGHQQFRIVRGGKPGKDAGAITTATTTKLQEGLLGAEKAVELGATALNTLTPESVGLKGQFNKVLINEGLAQLFPNMAKGDVTEAQTLLGNFNEKAVQALTASGDKRVSDKDMARFQRILPKMTAGESLESAKTKINTFLGELKREARLDAKTLSKPTPEWVLTLDEIVDLVSAGKMDIAHAKEIARKYQINK